MNLIHPAHLIALQADVWPDVRLYDKQWEVAFSAVTNRETYVAAGNQLGKDFVSAFVAVSCFLLCQAAGVTCRIVTTSVAEHHLKVLWGEIGRFIATARIPLLARQGGSLVINYQEVRRREEAGAKNPLSYLAGRVSAKGEGLAGHHVDFTMLIGDEASGLDDAVYAMGQGWAKHMLFIGNPNETQNWWRKAIEQGDRAAAVGADGAAGV